MLALCVCFPQLSAAKTFRLIELINIITNRYSCNLSRIALEGIDYCVGYLFDIFKGCIGFVIKTETLQCAKIAIYKLLMWLMTFDTVLFIWVLFMEMCIGALTICLKSYYRISAQKISVNCHKTNMFQLFYLF